MYGRRAFNEGKMHGHSFQDDLIEKIWFRGIQNSFLMYFSSVFLKFCYIIVFGKKDI